MSQKHVTATFTQGKSYTLKANFNGAIYSKPVYGATPVNQVTLTPSIDGMTVAFVPKVDGTVETFVISCTARNDPNDSTKMLTLTFTGKSAKPHGAK